MDFSFWLNEDKPSGKTPTEVKIADVVIEDNTTGFERVRNLFRVSEFGEISPELNTALQVGCMSMFVGGIYGGVKHSKNAYMEFFQNNQATLFNNHVEAKRKLQDKVTLAFGKGGLRFGVRLTLFTTTYMTLTSCIAAYRNKNGILEHVIGGTATGMLARFNLGLSGVLVGGGLGFVLGLFAGACQYGILKMSGMTMQEVQRRTGATMKYRDDVSKAQIQKALDHQLAELIERETTDPNVPSNLEGIE